MSQGKHKIIVQKAESIKENLSEVKKATEETTQKVEDLTVKEDEAFTKSEDLDLSERDRLNHLASSINHRADVYIEVRQLAESNGESLPRLRRIWLRSTVPWPHRHILPMTPRPSRRSVR